MNKGYILLLAPKPAGEARNAASFLLLRRGRLGVLQLAAAFRRV
jgi:hypothetical protein